MTVESDFAKASRTVQSVDPESVQQISAVVDAIFESDNRRAGGMRMRGVYKPQQIVPLVRVFLYAQKFKSPTAYAIALFLAESTVGLEGLGRDNMQESLKAILAGMGAEQAEPERRGLMARLLGR